MKLWKLWNQSSIIIEYLFAKDIELYRIYNQRRKDDGTIARGSWNAEG